MAVSPSALPPVPVGAAEDVLRLLFERAPDAIFLIDEGRFVDCNAAGIAQLRATDKAQVLQMRPGDLSPAVQPDGRPSLETSEDLMAQALAEGNLHTKWWCSRVDGTVFPADVTLTPIPFAGRHVLFTIVRDITEQVAAETALRISEASYREIFDSSNDAIYIHDLDTGAILDANRRAVELQGYSIEEIRERGVQIFAQDKAPFTAADALVYVQRAADGTPQTFEWQSRHRDGHHLWNEITLKRVQLGGTDRLLAMARDITERKQAEDALRASEASYREIFDSANDAIYIHDVETGMILDVNQKAVEMHGYSVDEFRTHGVDLVVLDERPFTAADALGYIQKAVAGEPQLFEWHSRHRSGRLFWNEVTIKRVVLNGADRLLVMGRDITERKKAEALQAEVAERKRSEEAAAEANRAKSEFLSRMSHELRTPMNSILGFAQVLARKPLAPDQRKSVDYILKAGNHLLNLINEVLDIARIEADRMPLSPEPVRVSGVVQEALTLIGPLATTRGCSVSESVTGSQDAYVLADRQRLTQVLLNLVSNAIKYNRIGGSVQITTQPVGDDRLALRVTDTGRGIAPADLPRLFAPFERLGAATSGEEGTGLGLALSKRLVEAMGGTMGVESTPGTGSTFWLELPLVESPEARLQRTRAAHPDGAVAPDVGPTGTLLYIEDNLANLSLIETILADRPGIRLYSALQGRLGLALATEHCPDLILLDLHLPDMAGDDVLLQLRADARTAATPVVVISADATAGHIARILAAGANAYLTKPLDVDRFLSTVDTVLKRKDAPADGG
jgi:PAS domain S-box-containing protein